MRSLATGFVYTATDLSETMLDDAYGMLAGLLRAWTRSARTPGSPPAPTARPATPGLLVETAATSEVPDWKEMLNWGPTVPEGHPMRRKYPHRFHDPVLPEADVPGITKVLTEFHDRVFDTQRRFLRIIATGLGAHESLFEELLKDGPVLNRAIRYPPMSSAPADGGPAAHEWAGAHADINLTTVLPRATEKGLQVRTKAATADDEAVWVDAVPARRPRDPEHRDHARAHVQRDRSRRAGTGWSPTPTTTASATRSCSSATRPRGRSWPRCPRR